MSAALDCATPGFPRRDNALGTVESLYRCLFHTYQRTDVQRCCSYVGAGIIFVSPSLHTEGWDAGLNAQPRQGRPVSDVWAGKEHQWSFVWVNDEIPSRILLFHTSALNFQQQMERERGQEWCQALMSLTSVRIHVLPLSSKLRKSLKLLELPFLFLWNRLAVGTEQGNPQPASASHPAQRKGTRNAALLRCSSRFCGPRQWNHPAGRCVQHLRAQPQSWGDARLLEPFLGWGHPCVWIPLTQANEDRSVRVGWMERTPEGCRHPERGLWGGLGDYHQDIKAPERPRILCCPRSPVWLRTWQLHLELNFTHRRHHKYQERVFTVEMGVHFPWYLVF